MFLFSKSSLHSLCTIIYSSHLNVIVLCIQWIFSFRFNRCVLLWSRVASLGIQCPRIFGPFVLAVSQSIISFVRVPCLQFCAINFLDLETMISKALLLVCGWKYTANMPFWELCLYCNGNVYMLILHQTINICWWALLGLVRHGHSGYVDG